MTGGAGEYRRGACVAASGKPIARSNRIAETRSNKIGAADQRVERMATVRRCGGTLVRPTREKHHIPLRQHTRPRSALAGDAYRSSANTRPRGCQC